MPARKCASRRSALELAELVSPRRLGPGNTLGHRVGHARLAESVADLVDGLSLLNTIGDDLCGSLLCRFLNGRDKVELGFVQVRAGAFRRWLRTITVNCLRDFWRSRRHRPVATGDTEFQKMLDELADPESGLSRLWDQEHDQHVTQRLLEMIRPKFEPKTWRAFQRVALDGATPDETAAELGLSVNAVFIAKSRVLARLREEGQGLID